MKMLKFLNLLTILIIFFVTTKQVNAGTPFSNQERTISQFGFVNGVPWVKFIEGPFDQNSLYGYYFHSTYYGTSDKMKLLEAMILSAISTGNKKFVVTTDDAGNIIFMMNIIN